MTDTESKRQAVAKPTNKLKVKSAYERTTELALAMELGALDIMEEESAYDRTTAFALAMELGALEIIEEVSNAATSKKANVQRLNLTTEKVETFLSTKGGKLLKNNIEEKSASPSVAQTVNADASSHSKSSNKKSRAKKYLPYAVAFALAGVPGVISLQTCKEVKKQYKKFKK